MGDRLLSQNTEPIRLVDAAVRDVWFRSAWQPRCQHVDGRGQCSKAATESRWNPDERCVERRCPQHAGELAPAAPPRVRQGPGSGAPGG